MSAKEKIDYIKDYVENTCCCLIDIFCTNVLQYKRDSQESLIFWKNKVSEAKTEADLRKVVALYI